MKFFIDTANLDEIREAYDMGILDGVTTNPTLMSKEGIQGKEAVFNHYRTICEIVKGGDVSAEVTTQTFDEMVAEAKELSKIHENIVVKIPMIEDGLKAIKWCADNGIRTNCTLIFNAGQALIAAKAGASYVSPFIGRIDDIGWDGLQLIDQIAQIFAIQNVKAEILAASIRNSLHIVKCAEAGADVCTCPLTSIKGLLHHPLTDSGLAKFTEDAKKFQ